MVCLHFCCNLYGSLFFVDVSFFYKEPTNVNSDMILDDDFLNDDKEEEEQSPDQSGPENNEGEAEQPEVEDEVIIPTYRNSYTCLADAYERFENEKYFSTTQISNFTSMKQTQSFKNICKFSDGLFSCEGFVYSDSSFGKKYYERTTAYDKETIQHIKSSNIDSSFNYNLNSLILNDTESYEEKYEYYMDHKFRPFFFKAQKGRDKQMRFDKDSNAKYYIVSIMFDVSAVPELYSSIIKDNAGASSVSFTSATADYYISKKTGKIMNFVAREKYSIVLPDYLNLKLDVEYETKIEFNYYSSPIDVVVK